MSTATTDPELMMMAPRDVAAAAKISVDTLNRAIRRGEAPPPSLVTGTTRRWLRATIRDWLSGRWRPGQAEAAAS